MSEALSVTLFSMLLGQGEDIHRLPGLGAVNFLQHGGGLLHRAAALGAGGDSDELFAADAVGDGEALHTRSQPRVPQGLAGLDVKGAEDAIEVADKTHPARG